VITVRCPTEADTRALGRRLASLIRPGDVVLLGGGLGVGKTVFASGLAEGLGVEERVLSPTFVLARHYEGLLPLVHADIYRVGTWGEIEDLELLPLAAEGVLVVEWGDAAEQSFPEDHLLIRLEAIEDDCRIATFVPSGSWAARPLQEVAG
jgi:tRNA threonylcarbamoyladenosine biosynthesis protein TsaE